MWKLSFAIAAMVAFCSCDLMGSYSENGELRIAFASGQQALTKVGLQIPDTSDFILTVSDAKGNVIYDGPYGRSPEAMLVKPGSYTVAVVSSEFSKPAFSAPQYGDEQCVVVPLGKSVHVKLVCTQRNCGIRLKVDPAFLDEYPDGVLLLKSSFGRLVYSYSEKRVAYFKPGDISLILSDKGKDEALLTRRMNASDMLDLKVGVASSGGVSGEEDDWSNSVSISIDTTRNWLNDRYVIGGVNGGSAAKDALSVSDALQSVGAEDVWVCGYVVGGDLTSSSASFEKPFSSRTNLLLGARSSVSERTGCLSVQLPSGEFRDDLNLVDNPGLLGRKLYIRGDIVEAYYGLPGIKNISEYELM